MSDKLSVRKATQPLDGFRTVRRRGFSLIETLVVVAIVSILAAITTPQFLNAMKSYRLASAVAAATGAIQTTHYLAIMHGYSYLLTFNANAGTYPTYQVASALPGATGFLPVPPGTPTPIAGSSEETINQTTVMQFNSNGTMTSGAAGNAVFTITNGVTTEQITVSGVGYVSVIVLPVTP
jgi:prepilin-type N-terminal cleavage/methylation domain-containing protein